MATPLENSPVTVAVPTPSDEDTNTPSKRKKIETMEFLFGMLTECISLLHNLCYNNELTPSYSYTVGFSSRLHSVMNALHCTGLKEHFGSPCYALMVTASELHAVMHRAKGATQGHTDFLMRYGILKYFPN